MLEDPPLLTIRRQFPRPAESALRSLQKIPTVYLVDAMGGRGALDYQIKPLGPITSQANAIRTAEAGFERQVLDGLAVPEFMATLLKSDRVRFEDDSHETA